MATIKVACPKCGQKVSGDEGFYGTVVECPICSSDILFPGQKRPVSAPGAWDPVPPESTREVSDLASREAARPDLAPDAVGQPRHSEDRPGKVEGAENDEPLLSASPIFGAISIVSAVLGVVTCLGGVLFAPLAIIFGHTALARARHSVVQPAPGHTLGAIGLMIGYVNLVLLILFLLVMTFFGDAIKEALDPYWHSLFPR